ncbi:MAG: cell division protein FtsQ/DivIB [Nitrosomonadales bacterium]|nr:cell division protein FtsQ/DivIB [Nitrosomonadales bacterium]
MWDKPHSLNRLSGALFGISLLLVLAGALHYTLHLPVFPLRALQLSAAPQRVSHAQIEAVARDAVVGNFFTVDLESTRQAFEKLPWVRRVSVRRHFPWRIEVSLEEHEALAQWNGSGLVNTRGEVFAAELPGRAGRTLPKFIGQPDAAAEIARMYRVFGERIAPLGREIAQVSLSPRRAWQLRLDNGMVLELGSGQAQQRLERFVAVYSYSIAPLLQGGNHPFSADAGNDARGNGDGENGPGQTVKYVDLRYRSGFAVSLAGGAAESQGRRSQGGRGYSNARSN